MQVSTGSLSPIKGQAQVNKWPPPFDLSVISIAALLSDNSTEGFVPSDLTNVPLAAIPCPPLGSDNKAAVMATFDSFLAKQGIRLSGTPVQVEFKLQGNADEEESQYEWLEMIWGLSPDDPLAISFPSQMVWIPTPRMWCSF